MLFLLLLG